MKQTINDVKVIFVRVNFEKDKKIFIINDKYKSLNIYLEELFSNLEKDDLYKTNKIENYVKYNIYNNSKYIFCIEPDFTENNDDTSILVNELFDILTNIYNSIIIIFKKYKKLNKDLKLKLSFPSIIDDNVSMINKKTILGCFSKIYKKEYKEYEYEIDNDELKIYFQTLLRK